MMLSLGQTALDHLLQAVGAVADPASGVVSVPLKFIEMNKGITIAAFMLGIAQIPFILNFFMSMKNGKKIESDNPWDATTLEWQTPTPPPHGNFDKEIRVYRGPYEYSVPGADKDFTPQNEPRKEDPKADEKKANADK